MHLWIKLVSGDRDGPGPFLFPAGIIGSAAIELEWREEQKQGKQKARGGGRQPGAADHEMLPCDRDCRVHLEGGKCTCVGGSSIFTPLYSAAMRALNAFLLFGYV